MGRFQFVCVALLATTITVPASASSLIQNGGFETGDFSGWELSGNLGYTGVDEFQPRSGLFSAYMGPVTADGVLAQSFQTQPGASYQISFWLGSEGGVPNRFDVAFDGAQLLSIKDEPAIGYRNYTIVGTATGDIATLRFTYRHIPALWRLDDVSVTPLAAIPEPGSWAMMIAGFGVIGAALRQRRRRAHLGVPAVAC